MEIYFKSPSAIGGDACLSLHVLFPRCKAPYILSIKRLWALIEYIPV